MLKRCLAYFMRYKARLAVAILGMVVVAPCSAASAWLVKKAVDDVLINKDVVALKFVTVGIVVLMTAKGVFRFLQNYYMNTSGLLAINDLRNDLYARIVCLPMDYFNESQVGMLMSRVLNDVGLIRASLPSMVMFTREVFSVIGLAVYVFYLDWKLAFWGTLVLPAALYPFIYYSKRMRKLGRRTQSHVSDVSVRLQEGLSGIKVIKGFAKEKEEISRFRDENAKLVTSNNKQILASEQSSRVMETVGSFAAGLVLWYGGSRVIEGDLTTGALLSFLTALALLYEPIKRMNATNIDIQMALTGAERVFEIMDKADGITERGGSVEFTGPFRDIAFEDVTFSYSGANRPALDGVSLQVKAGERIAIVGSSGSGKTTLANMVPRFFDPQGGRILLNGRPLADYTLTSLRRSMGLVSQEAFLFNASVRENIAYGAVGGYSQEEVEAAAKAAYAHDFILELPEGYDTLVGERGVKLSGGQKQRLTIARAIMKNPPLLILDEATSALDTESERIVQLALENLMQHRTSLVIAHRLSTILTADLIVVVENGRIVDQGKHAKLLERCDIYRTLYEMQFGAAG
ncbi:MAG: ABC transporter ATP-binding protein/permease [Proteobacteria bacterium]|nr:ABC transporter ATP-binding protein/permease [Pseudomonadota bacterium]MBU1596118.1 ABC transporter ATP-binding protein/permease [Pseudomonadota bacterium]